MVCSNVLTIMLFLPICAKIVLAVVDYTAGGKWKRGIVSDEGSLLLSRNDAPLFRFRLESCRQTLLSSNLTSLGRFLAGLAAGGGGSTGTITGINATGVVGPGAGVGGDIAEVNGDVAGK